MALDHVGQKEKALNMFKEIVKRSEGAEPFRHSMHLDYLYNLGLKLSYLENYAELKEIVDQLHHYIVEFEEFNTRHHIDYLILKGDLLHAEKNRAVFAIMDSIIQLRENLYGPEHGKTIEQYYYKAKYYADFKEGEKAFGIVETVLSDLEDANKLNNFQIDEYLNVLLLYHEIIESNSIKIPQKDKLKQVYLTNKLIENHKMSSQWTTDKLKLSVSYGLLNAIAIKLYCEEYLKQKKQQYISASFYQIESSKALLLWESFIETQLFDKSTLPDSIQIELSLLEHNIKKQEAAHHEAEDKNQAIIDLDLLKTKRQNILESLKTSKLSNSPYLTGYALPSMKEVQEKLKSDENIINFLQTDSSLFAVLLNADTAHLFKLETGEQFNKALNRYIDNTYNLADNVLNDSYKQTYTADAYSIYQILDTIFQYISKNEKVIIIPDGQISYLPFETLLSQEVSSTESYQNFPYLIHDYQFSYAYSASVWSVLQTEEKSKDKVKMAAFGPLDNAGLANAQKEVNFLTKFFKAQSFNGEQSGKATFLSQLNSKQNIHLAVHGKSDTSEIGRSFLSFGALDDEENKLFDYEIAAARIEAPLLVMNACETATGKNYTGEGVLSLSRSMVQAGCKNVVSSLWQVNDEVAFTLVKDFYKQLKRGNNVSAALHKAKIKHLSASDEILAHPYFWATLVHTGNDEVRLANRKNTNYLWLLLLIFPVLWVLRKKQ